MWLAGADAAAYIPAGPLQASPQPLAPPPPHDSLFPSSEKNRLSLVSLRPSCPNPSRTPSLAACGLCYTEVPKEKATGKWGGGSAEEIKKSGKEAGFCGSPVAIHSLLLPPGVSRVGVGPAPQPLLISPNDGDNDDGRKPCGCGQKAKCQGTRAYFWHLGAGHG